MMSAQSPLTMPLKMQRPVGQSAGIRQEQSTSLKMIGDATARTQTRAPLVLAMGAPGPEIFGVVVRSQ